jgi:hypothetical protein
MPKLTLTFSPSHSNEEKRGVEEREVLNFPSYLLMLLRASRKIVANA